MNHTIYLYAWPRVVSFLVKASETSDYVVPSTVTSISDF